MSIWGDPADTASLSEGIDRHVEAADTWERHLDGGGDPTGEGLGLVERPYPTRYPVVGRDEAAEPDDPKASLAELARATGVLADTAERAVRDLRVAVDMLTASVK